MIKDSKGNPYKLQKPNPLVEGQELWMNKEKYILHNFSWDKILIELTDLLPTFVTQDDVKPIEKKEEIKEEEEEIKEEEEEIKEEEIVRTKIAEETKKKLNLKNLVMMHCLPVVTKETKDELYNETRKATYGEKITFECVIVKRDDLCLMFWTNVDVAKNSIVYPSKYRDGVKFGEYRWWKINDYEEKAGGFLIQAIPSDYQPDFT